MCCIINLCYVYRNINNIFGGVPTYFFRPTVHKFFKRSKLCDSETFLKGVSDNETLLNLGLYICTICKRCKKNWSEMFLQILGVY